MCAYFILKVNERNTLTDFNDKTITNFNIT